MNEAAAKDTIDQRFAALASRVGNGTLIFNRGDYLSVMRKETPYIEML